MDAHMLTCISAGRAFGCTYECATVMLAVFAAHLCAAAASVHRDSAVWVCSSVLPWSSLAGVLPFLLVTGDWGMGVVALCPATGRPRPLHLQPQEGPAPSSAGSLGRAQTARLQTPSHCPRDSWENWVEGERWVQAWAIALPRITEKAAWNPYEEAANGSIVQMEKLSPEQKGMIP